jgi:8-oxo-dGTP pyrophosphatase MutT (NUDIX family)
MSTLAEARAAARQVTDVFLRVAYRGAYSLAMAYWFVRRPSTEGVCVGVWCGRRVLLLQNSYKPLFSMPGGGPHPGESHLETGLRELREEVGLRPSASALRAAYDVVDTGEYKSDHVFFLELDVEAALQLPLTSPVRAYLSEATRRRAGPSPREAPLEE